jgi:hypothetical protein
MATLILSTVGTALGGPIGGAIGAVLGRVVDSAVIGTPTREGPRLTELAVSTSSYGQPVPRVFGTMRVPGAIIWATELVESSETSGGKGQPKATSYSYAISFAVALSSRPVAAIGRIWADGALLRGSAGDLKVGGVMRLHKGTGDDEVDPLIAADKGVQACAFRGLAYAVFEDLELASFGNRIPALSFEVSAPDDTLDASDLLDRVRLAPGAGVPLTGLRGFVDQGGSRADLLARVAQVFPLTLCATAEGLLLSPVEAGEPIALPPPVAGRLDGEDRAEPRLRRRTSTRDVPSGLRYYDPARDYQPSLQRAPGNGGASEQIEFPGAFAAHDAQARIATLRRRALTARDTLQWRLAEPAEGIAPGAAVTRTDQDDVWRVTSWEWHADGIDLGLERIARIGEGRSVADPGSGPAPRDEVPGELVLRYVELPWDGSGDPATPQRYAALSMAGTRSAIALSALDGESLLPPGAAARGDTVQGASLAPLAPSHSLLFEPDATLEIALVSAGMQLQSVDMPALLGGANRLLLGEEVLQFHHAEPLGEARWRLTGLLRGRGGTEHHAAAGHPAGAAAILIDQRLVALPGEDHVEIAALPGVGTTGPVYAALVSTGITQRPLTPVHPHTALTGAGDSVWSWVRRARGGWRWQGGVDVPLVEEREAYRIGLGPLEAPHALWEVAEPRFSLSQTQWADLRARHPDALLWVRQIGSHGLSHPVRLPSDPS